MLGDWATPEGTIQSVDKFQYLRECVKGRNKNSDKKRVEETQSTAYNEVYNEILLYILYTYIV